MVSHETVGSRGSRVHTDEHLIRLHGIYRSKVEHEDNLINWRTTWFIATQSMLFITVALFSGKASELQFQILSSILGLVSIAICFTTFMSVRAAREVISDHVRFWDGITGLHSHLDLPRLAGSVPGAGWVARGSISSFFMPIAAASAWVSILVSIWFLSVPEVSTSASTEFLRGALSETSAVTAPDAEEK